MASGAASLTNAELIAVILRTGTSGASAVDLARKVLEIRSPGREALSVLYDLTLEDLVSIRGIGQVKAVKLLCLAELSRRLYRFIEARYLSRDGSGFKGVVSVSQ